MNKAREEAMQDAYTIIRRQVIYEVLDTIMSKQDAIKKLLDNGMPLLYTTDGERFEKLRNKRKKLWNKLHYLGEAWDMVYDIRK